MGAVGLESQVCLLFSCWVRGLLLRGVCTGRAPGSLAQWLWAQTWGLLPEFRSQL